MRKYEKDRERIQVIKNVMVALLLVFCVLGIFVVFSAFSVFIKDYFNLSDVFRVIINSIGLPVAFVVVRNLVRKYYGRSLWE